MKSFLHFADQTAAGHGHDHVLGRPPAELLRDLEADRFGAFGIKRPKVDVYESPSIFEGDLGTQAIDLIVGTGDADDLGAIDGGAENLCRLQVAGDEDVAFQSSGRGV